MRVNRVPSALSVSLSSSFCKSAHHLIARNKHNVKVIMPKPQPNDEMEKKTEQVHWKLLSIWQTAYATTTTANNFFNKII